jgi:hypothetical protein
MPIDRSESGGVHPGDSQCQTDLFVWHDTPPDFPMRFGPDIMDHGAQALARTAARSVPRTWIPPSMHIHNPRLLWPAAYKAAKHYGHARSTWQPRLALNGSMVRPRDRDKFEVISTLVGATASRKSLALSPATTRQPFAMPNHLVQPQ